jgi:hypothetical protein
MSRQQSTQNCAKCTGTAPPVDGSLTAIASMLATAQNEDGRGQIQGKSVFQLALVAKIIELGQDPNVKLKRKWGLPDGARCLQQQSVCEPWSLYEQDRSCASHCTKRKKLSFI